MNLLLIVFFLAGMAPNAGSSISKWTPSGISSPKFESHPAFDPKNGDLYFVRSSPQFQGWRILVSHCTDKGWGEPEEPSFAGDGVEADPFFADDGRTLFFISTRSDDGMKKQLDIWFVTRDDHGEWGKPVRHLSPINSEGNEWFPRPGPDGWLYFGSDRAGGRGATDIYRARSRNNGHARFDVENLGTAINTVGDEYEALISPDGTRMIIMADGELFESRMTDTGWAPRTKLPPEINQPGLKVGALFSPTGKTLMFARDTGSELSGELFVWHIDGDEKWPPECLIKEEIKK